MAAKTYYEILEVEPTATAEEIKQSRRLLRAAWHPDKFKGTSKKQAEEKFKDIEEAYDVLSNPQKRAVYDSNLAHQRSAEANHQHAQEAQRRQEEERRRHEEEGRRRDNQQQEERRRREEESRQRENRHYGAQPNYPPGSVAQTTGTNSGLWFTLSIIMTLISLLAPLHVSAPFGMLFSYLAMRSGRRTGGMVMLVINGALVALMVRAILLFHP